MHLYKSFSSFSFPKLKVYAGNELGSRFFVGSGFYEDFASISGS
jgi:hypothetical protein